MSLELHQSEEDTAPATRAVRSAVLTATLLITSLAIALVAPLDIGPAKGLLAEYQVLWPQKWSFFTNFDTITLVAYRVDPDAGDLSPSDERHSRARRLLGLNRIDDVRQVEARPLGKLIPNRYWQECARDELAACLSELDRGMVYRVRNPARRPVICGPTAVAAERTATPPPGTLPTLLGRVVNVALAEVECVG